jgi:putative spermidine/putrescine transport system ATP-binding protein
MSTIELAGVSKHFGSVRALDELSIQVASGELLALLGPSGCGKTTLLRIVAGLESPTSGTVSISGIDVTDSPARKRSIGMVFQSYALFPNLTVRQNIAFPLEVRRRPAREVAARVEELLELVHLRPEADRYPHQISGGQAQRCALGRALAPAPEVLLLDEPLSALDVLVRVRLRDEIRRIQGQVKTTTIYVTHDHCRSRLSHEPRSHRPGGAPRGDLRRPVLRVLGQLRRQPERIRAAGDRGPGQAGQRLRGRRSG